ncbi:hypothetical protein HQ585_00360 [candidate division KSB1 bacterium]|nr:hypothetical protein [candidate division KSB1 bacterium]
MSRRKTRNVTGISRIEGIPYHDAWISYICVNCKELNLINIGQELLQPSEAFENSIWECTSCGFRHCKGSDLPFENWPKAFIDSDSITSVRFWQAFFRIATEHKESYWKQCNCCGRVLSFSAFSKHSDWGPLERQMECRGCKGAINAELNPKRTKQQLYESSIRRRAAELLLEGENETIIIEDLFKRFKGKCFKTKKDLEINDRQSWASDHILPSKYLYPLTIQNTALLSKEANESKRDKWPNEFYTNNELIELAKITGANLELLSSKMPIINTNIDVDACVTRLLMVREQSNLNKRLSELKKLLISYNLVDALSNENKKLLGF